MSRTINFSTDNGEVLIMQDKVNAAKIIGSTIKVWLNNDTPYEFNYENREKAKEDFAKFKKYLNEDDEKIINEKLIDKACEWLSQTDFCHYYNKEFIDNFRKAMEE